MVYKINVTSGAATAIGPLGQDFARVDLTWMFGRLFAKNALYSNTINEISVTGANAGNVVQTWLVKGMMYGFDKIGGLAAAGSTPYVTYSNNGLWQAAYFGTWDFYTGWIFNDGPVGTPDSDGMGYFDNKFWIIDLVDEANGYNVVSGMWPNAFSVIGGDLYDSNHFWNPTDIEDFSSTEMVAMGESGQWLIRLSKANGARTAVIPISGAPGDAKFEGIARSPLEAINHNIRLTPR